MKIVYQTPTASISILIPSEEYVQLHGIVTLALKDVPEGLPFWIVEDSEIPEDHTFRDAWEIPEEWGEPVGFGSPFYTFKELVEDTEDAEN